MAKNNVPECSRRLCIFPSQSFFFSLEKIIYTFWKHFHILTNYIINVKAAKVLWYV
jgi:hypothetical protein